jgi:hypothetical protein
VIVVQVRAADAAGADAQLDFVGLKRVWRVDLLDAEIMRSVDDDGERHEASRGGGWIVRRDPGAAQSRGATFSLGGRGSRA